MFKKMKLEDQSNFLSIVLKVYIIAVFIEFGLDRFFYRIGTTFQIGEMYYFIEGIGTFFRYFMVLLNFLFLFLIVTNKIYSTSLTTVILVQTVIFLTYYIMTFLGLNISVEFDAMGKIITLLIIEMLLFRAFSKNESYKIFYRILIVCIQIIIAFALVYKIAFTLNAKYNISEEIFNFFIWLRFISEILTVVMLCWVAFAFPLFIIKIDSRIDLKKLFSQKRQYVPFIIVLLVTVMMLVLLNIGIEIVTEEHLWTFYDIFAWTAIYVLGFSTIYISAFYFNFAIISLMMLLTAILLLRKIGNFTQNYSLNRLAYGLFILFCGSFTFLEYGDIYFLIITFVGITVIAMPFFEAVDSQIHN